MQDHYLTIEKEGKAEFRDRGSRFIAYAFPISSVEIFKKRLTELKEKHPKAAHHCFAYRLELDGSVFRTSDDREPSGSAGKQILGQMDSRQLTNVAVIVVRYFGGQLLGIPGLINAYKTVTSYAFQMVPIVQKPVVVHYQLEFDYMLQNEVMMQVKAYRCEILENERLLFCRMKIGIPKQVSHPFLEKITSLQGLDIKQI